MNRHLLILILFLVGLPSAADKTNHLFPQTKSELVDVFGEALGDWDILFNISDEMTDETGVPQNSSVWKHRDRFEEMGSRVSIMLKKDARELQALFQDDHMKVFFTPYTISHPDMDGVMLNFKDSYSLFGGNGSWGLNYIFSRLSDRVSVSDKFWEDINREHRDYLYGLNMNIDLNNRPYSFWGGRFQISHIGTHYINQVHLDRDLHNVFTGQYDSHAVADAWQDHTDNTVYVRISSINPRKTGVSAKVYSFAASAGDVSLVQSGIPGTDQYGGQYNMAQGSTVVVYAVENIPAGAEDLKFRILVSGGYLVQAHLQNYFIDYDIYEGLPPDTVMYSDGEYPLHDNLEERKFAYGLNTANMNLGFTMRGKLLGFNYNAELDFNIQHRMFPATNVTEAATPRETSPAFHIEFDRRFGPVKFNGEYHYISPDYRTTFQTYHTVGGSNVEYIGYNSVADNDDNDIFSPALHALEDLEGRGVDNNQNSIADFYEDFLLFRSDPYFFKPGFDANNNYIPDEDSVGNRIEDDNFPDHPYRLNRTGYSARVAFPLSVLNVVVGHKYNKVVPVSIDSLMNYTVLRYSHAFPQNSGLDVEQEFRRVRDSIRDNYAGIAQTVYSGTDTLDFTDSLVSVTSLGLKNVFFSRLHSRFRMKMMINRQKEIDSLLYNTGMLYHIHYDWPLGGLTISPNFKVSMEKQSRSAKLSLTEPAILYNNIHVWSTGLLFRYNILGGAWINAGTGVLRYLDKLIPDNSYQNTSVVMEMLFNGEDRDRAIVFITGGRFRRRKLLGNPAAIPVKTFEYYIRFYLR